MSRNASRVRVNYDLSKQAEKVFKVLESCFPHARIYVEYPYAHLLSQYYKHTKTPIDQQDRYLLSLTRLHADFVLPDFNIVIEVDGEQHFQPVCFGGISQEQAESRFADQQNRDNLKARICVEMEHTLVQIKYDQEVTSELIFDLIKNEV